MINIHSFKNMPQIFKLIVLAYGLSAAATCLGQAVSGSQVSGQVVDSNSGDVPNAELTITQTQTGYVRVTKTDAQGSYAFPDLVVGPYSLAVTAPGFKRYEQEGILLEVGTHVQINPKLEIGAVTEKVEVRADADMVETSATSISQVINQNQIIDLPLNGRQATQLILISGASVSSPSLNLTSSKNYQSSVAISVAGGQGNGTNYLLDGGDNNDTFSNVNLPFPFPDALQEFSVETNALPARNGLHPGGVVNVVTKSGTNQLHGTLFEFLRNGDANGRNYFAAQQDTLKRNQFGGTAGGKIISDKLFFFGGYQSTINRQDPPGNVAYVPTQAALTGNFSSLESAACQASGKTRTIVNPSTGAPFANGQVPVGLFDPVALKIAAKLPATSDPCGRVTYAIPTQSNEEQIIGRIDWNLNSKQAAFVRYFVADYSQPVVSAADNALLSHANGNLERSQSMTIGDTYTFSPHLLNLFHFTFTRLRDNRTVPDGYNAASLGVNMYDYDPSGMLLSVTGGFSTGVSGGVFNRNTFQGAEDVDIARGKHQIAFGVDFLRTQNNLVSDFNRNGNFAFSGQFSGDATLDFLLGDMSSFQQSRAQINVYRETMLGLYLQDSYKLSHKVSINAGLRWEPLLYPQDYFGRGASITTQGFYANEQSKVYTNAPAGMLFYGDHGVSKAFTNDKFTNFSPRLGIIINPHGDGRETIRIGGGILYDSPEVYYSERLTTNAPYGNSLILANPGPLSNPWVNYPGGNPFPGVYPPNSSVTFPQFAAYSAIPPNLNSTYMGQWNVSYERQLAANWLASVTYLGNKTSHLWLSVDVNPSVYMAGQCGSSACSTTANANQRRVLYLANPNQGQYYGSLITTDDGANAFYSGLLTSIQHRFSHGFNLLANYTWSHCIDDGDFTGNVGNEQYQNQAIPAGRRADRGSCGFDVRHVFNVSFVGISPSWGGGVVGKIIGNWQFAPLVRTSSGLPVLVATGKDNSLTGIGLDRPNVVPGVNPYNPNWGPKLQWLNANAFVQNPLGTFGNLGRDVLRVPGLVNVDAALSRILALRERFSLEVRLEAFNAINHTNFQVPKTSTVQILNIDAVTASNFGQLNAAYDPRILQAALKLHF